MFYLYYGKWNTKFTTSITCVDTAKRREDLDFKYAADLADYYTATYNRCYVTFVRRKYIEPNYAGRISNSLINTVYVGDRKKLPSEVEYPYKY